MKSRFILLILVLFLAIISVQLSLLLRNRSAERDLAAAAARAEMASPTSGPRFTLVPTFTPTASPTPLPTDTPTVTLTPTASPTATASPTPTSTPTPPLPPQVAADVANLRAGPGPNYELMGRLNRGTPLEVIGRTEAGDWLAVRTQADAQAWIAAELVVAAPARETLVVLTPPPTPTPRPPTPTPAPISLAAVPAGSARVSRIVLANYFAWYDAASWDGCNISAGDRPQQPYGSDDPAAIARHIDMALNAGVDGFTLQWATPGDRTDRNFATLLNRSQGTNFQSTIVFLRHIWPGASQGNTIESLRYVLGQYGGQPNFLKINGRPVIFITDVYRVPRSGGSAQDAWAYIRGQVDPGRTAWWIAEGLDASFLSVFDGLWVYKVSHAAYPNDFVKASRWASRARAWEQRTGQPKLWVGTLMPGWDDRRAGCRPDVRVPSAPFVRDREGGNFYRATFNAAAASNPDLLWIHSFNEWVEGSYIEPSQAYGDVYLNLTRELSAQFKGQ